MKNGKQSKVRLLVRDRYRCPVWIPLGAVGFGTRVGPGKHDRRHRKFGGRHVHNLRSVISQADLDFSRSRASRSSLAQIKRLSAARVEAREHDGRAWTRNSTDGFEHRTGWPA